MTARVSELVCLLIFSTAVAAAQFPRSAEDRNMVEFGAVTSSGIRGQIANDSEQVFVNIFVELCEHTGRIVSRTAVLGSGDFYFDSVAPGYYTLRVMDDVGHVLGEQAVDPSTSSGTIRVNLAQPCANKPISGSVSLAELQHKVPGKALKEEQLAEKAFRKKDLLGGIPHLQKALEIDPEFFAARRNLAKAYLLTNRNDKAVPILEKIIETDPKSVMAYDGLGSVYLAARRFGDAEIAARKALAIDASNEFSHWLLGCSLAALGHQDAEALKQFAMAGKRFPRAHILAAEILARQRRKEEARHELQAYLETGNPESRAEVEEAIKSLL